MATTFTKYCLILVALTACCLAYFSFTLPVNENKRILSTKTNEFYLSTLNSCGRAEECPEGEEAYLRTYPDVAKKRLGKNTAYRHYKLYGKEEGRHYICNCPKSEVKAVIEPKIKNESGFIVLAMFKNEAMNFKEWISHYLWQEASHFYLIDDGSTDDYLATMDKEVLARITIIKGGEKKHRQVYAYNSLLPMLQEKHSQDWALVVDFDEFLYGRPPQTIASYLSTVSDDIAQVSFPWYIFGSSGHARQPKSVRCSFVQRSSMLGEFKSAVRISSLERFGVHGHGLLPGSQIHKEKDRLHLNHYKIQSKEYFGKIKMTRGNVANPNKLYKETWDYFEKINGIGSKIIDRELCSILGCCAS